MVPSSFLLPLLQAYCAIIAVEPLSYSYSPTIVAGRRRSNAGTAASARPMLQRAPTRSARHSALHNTRDTPPLPSFPSSSSSLHMVLGGSRLDSGAQRHFRDGRRWRNFLGDGGRSPSPASNSTTAMRMALGNNFNIGGNRRRPPNGNGANGGNVNGGGIPKVVSISQPQDLLDFVIQDERLSVVKVYASWCKTCAVFDTRYRKLAAQLGDTSSTPAKGSSVTRRGPVRFAEMKYDDPNNEEMCKLLNATQLPYILMYKGSKGKVAAFQCGPAKFQRLLDAVSEHVDADAGGGIAENGAAVAGAGGAGGLPATEREWSVMQEEQRKGRQTRDRYGTPLSSPNFDKGSGNNIVNYPSETAGAKLQQKEKELVRLYSELAALRADFDRRIISLKETHATETSALEGRLQEQTTAFDHERRALAKQIEELSREVVDREKSFLEESNVAARKQEADRKEKDEEYKKNLTELNLRIGELEQDLRKSRDELRHDSDVSTKDRQRLRDHITQLESEIAGLSSRNEELERELIEEKRLVVESAEEAARVLGRLNAIKGSENEERQVLRTRIQELEERIELREQQLLDMAASSPGDNNNADAYALREVQRELVHLKKEHERERERLGSRIAELEAELDRYRDDSGESSRRLGSHRREQFALQQDAAELASKILALEDEIDERDKLLRTSSKATDILLDNMETQKREYEAEMERTGALVEELEEAIEGRERELEMLQIRIEEHENRIKVMTSSSSVGNANVEQEEQQSQVNGNSMGEVLDQERRARVAAEQEVGKLMGYLQDRDEELLRMRQQDDRSAGTSPKAPGWFGEFSALFNGGSGNENAVEVDAGWDSPWRQEAPNSNEEEQEIENYERLKDVLMSSEGTSSPLDESQANPWFDGAGRRDYVWQGDAPPSDLSAGENAARDNKNLRDGAGLSSLVSELDGNTGGDRRDAFLQGLQQTPLPVANVPTIAPAELPTPAMAFERRLAENPIVPAGAFGGSKPTSSFFSPRTSAQAMAPQPSETPEYYQPVVDGFNAGRQRQEEKGPMSAYNQRPSTPAPRGAAESRRDNIYAGAGTVGGAAQAPTPVPREPPVAPQPTPAMEFERRIAENPIVPAGAFGASPPTAHLFRPKADSPPVASSGGRGASFGAASAGGGDTQSKWQHLNDNEKKRVAEEAYKAFEKSLQDRRGTAPQSKQKMKGGIGRGIGERGGRNEDVSSKHLSKPTAPGVTKPIKKQSSSISTGEPEHMKHQDVVKAATAATKGQQNNKANPPRTVMGVSKNPVARQQQQSAQQIQASAAQASAKRMSLAELAAKADKDRKEKEKQRRAESRKSQEAKQLELKRAAELEQLEQAKNFKLKETKEAEQLEQRKRNEEIQRAKELKRKAEADLALAAQAKAKADAEVAKQEREESRFTAKEQTDKGSGDAIAAQQERMGTTGATSLDRTEIIEAALLGAEEGDEARSWKVPKPGPTSETSTSKRRQAKTQKKVAVAAGSGFDVMVLKDTKNTQVLEGSLKDLLKDQGPLPKRNSGNLNY